MEKFILDIIIYLASIFLIVGLKMLSNPKTATKGNLIAAISLGSSMIVALIYPLEVYDHQNYIWIFIALAIGALIGFMLSKKVAMTAMPELISFFNGLGGLCSLTISVISLKFLMTNGSLILESTSSVFLLYFNMFLGAVTFSGSVVAYGKLNGSIKSNFRMPFASLLNFALLVISFLAIIYFTNIRLEISTLQIIFFIIFSIIYGITFVIPIGGADMPVVISLLNSLSGVAAAIAGAITNDKLMLLGGILVGSSGTILSVLMCKAMNRSLFNVIFGSFANLKNQSSDAFEGKKAKQTSSSDLAFQLIYAQKVVIIPGYGLAVSQAQKLCKELENVLSEHHVELRYAIHPVAGRMPGHMNVLLAEAEIEYEKLMDLDEANLYLKDTDVAIVVGANDVVNPSAKEDPKSSIYGMPIIELDKVKNVVIVKRSMATGYAGIPNPLFYKENAAMLLGDAKVLLQSLVEEVRKIK